MNMEFGSKAVIFFKSISENIQNPFAFYIPSSEQVNPNDFDKEYLPAILNNFPTAFEKIEIARDKVKDIEFLWNPIDYNEFAINDDFTFFDNFADFSHFKKNGVHFIGEENIKIGRNVIIAPGAVIDAEEGPVIIDDNAKIMANTYLQGPLYIGRNCLIKAGAKIYEGTSFGE